jgi:hypothetical protein
MYFIDNKENKPELQYNYYNTLSKKLNETEISFIGKTNNPNLIIRNGSHDTKYISSKLYLFSKSNSMSNKYISKNSLFGLGFGSSITSDYDAELVIEHKSITNTASTNKVLICFLLKTDVNGNPNIIDKIINSDVNANLEIELNNVIPHNDQYIYQNSGSEFDTKLKDTIIIIFTTPILCKSKFGNIENMENMIEGVDLTLSEGEYLECSAADIDGDEITTYNVALNQQVPQDSIKQFNTAAYLISTFLIISICFFVTPAAYSLLLSFVAKANSTMQIFKNIFITDWAIGSLIFWPAFILFFIGIGYVNDKNKKNDTTGRGYIGISINMLMFLIINIVIIQFKKMIDPKFTGLKITGTSDEFSFNNSSYKDFINDKFVSKNPLRLLTSIFGLSYIFLGKGPFFEPKFDWNVY